MSNFNETNGLLDLSVDIFSPIASSSQQCSNTKQQVPPQKALKSSQNTTISMVASDLWSNYTSFNSHSDQETTLTQFNHDALSCTLFNSFEWQTAQDEHYKEMEDSTISRIKKVKKKSNNNEIVPFLVAIVIQAECVKSGALNSVKFRLKDPTGEIKAVFIEDSSKSTEITEHSVLVLKNFKMLKTKGRFTNLYVCFKREHIVAIYSPKNIDKVSLFTQKCLKTKISQNVDRKQSEMIGKPKEIIFLMPDLDLDLDIESENTNLVRKPKYTTKLSKNILNTKEKVGKSLKETQFLMPDLDLELGDDFNESTLIISSEKQKKSTFEMENVVSQRDIFKNISNLNELYFKQTNVLNPNLDLGLDVISPEKRKKLRLENEILIKETEKNKNSTKIVEKNANTYEKHETIVEKTKFLMPNLDLQLNFDSNNDSTLKIDISPEKQKKSEIGTKIISNSLSVNNCSTKNNDIKTKLNKFKFRKREAAPIETTNVPSNKLAKSDDNTLSQITIKTQNPQHQEIANEVFNGLDFSCFSDDF